MLYLARGPMKTRLVLTMVDFNLTVGAVVTRATGARVAPAPRVGARPRVLAGRVVGAEVQI